MTTEQYRAIVAYLSFWKDQPDICTLQQACEAVGVTDPLEDVDAELWKAGWKFDQSGAIHYANAWIDEKVTCGNCGWPVVRAFCNDRMAFTEPFSGNDYWAYCSNKACTDHAGQGYSQVDPDFIEITEIAP
jgi:hypothetical protein